MTRFEHLTEKVLQAEANLSAAGTAIAQHIATHRDIRTCVMEGRICRLVGGAKDLELVRLESERNGKLREFHAVLEEYAALKQSIEKGEDA